MDFVGRMDGNAVFNSHSKWIEVFGIPETILSDNITQFVASEFKEFCQSMHMLSKCLNKKFFSSPHIHLYYPLLMCIHRECTISKKG